MLSHIIPIGHPPKWGMLISEFDIQYVNRKTIKGQPIVDHLADAPLMDDFPLVMDFLDEHLYMIEEKPSWKLYFEDPIPPMVPEHKYCWSCFLVNLTSNMSIERKSKDKL